MGWLSVAVFTTRARWLFRLQTSTTPWPTRQAAPVSRDQKRSRRLKRGQRVRQPLQLRMRVVGDGLWMLVRGLLNRCQRCFATNRCTYTEACCVVGNARPHLLSLNDTPQKDDHRIEQLAWLRHPKIRHVLDAHHTNLGGSCAVCPGCLYGRSHRCPDSGLR